MIRRPPRSTQSRSSAASDVYKRQVTVSLLTKTTPFATPFPGGSLEASALTHASQRGLLARRSPLLKLQGDAKLIAMARSGNTGAFEAIVDRYQGRPVSY